MNNVLKVEPGSIANAIDKLNETNLKVTGFPHFTSCDFDGDTPNGEPRVHGWTRLALSLSLKVKLFGIKVVYRPTKWPGLQSQLPSRTQFRKLSGRRKRLVGKSIERYIISKGASNGNSSE